MVGAARGELGAGQVEDALPGALGRELHRPEEILARVAEPHTAGDPGLVGGHRAAQVERHHALVGVPDVDHPVGVVVGHGHRQHAEQVVPVRPEVGQGAPHGPRVEPAVDHRPDAGLVDQAGGLELSVARVLPVAEKEDDLLLLARFECEPDVMRAVRRPAVRERVGQLAPLDPERLVEPPVGAEEGLALGVETGQRLGAGEVGEVVAALPVLGLVVDHAVGDLDLPGGVVPLVVGGVVLRVPQGELDRGEDGQLGRGVAVVGDGEPPDLERLAARREVERARPDPFLGRADRGVRHPVPALVGVQLGAGGLPGRRPVLAVGVVPEVEVAPARVGRHVVVAVPGEAPQPGVLLPRVAAGRVRDDAVVSVRAQVVDPRHRRVGAGDHVFAVLVVEEAIAQHERHFTG